MVSRRYLEPMKALDIDTLVLGCTHYPLLKSALQTVMGKEIRLIDSAEETALEVMKLLREKDFANKSDGNGECIYYLTDIPHRFTETGKRFLGEDLENVNVIDI